MKHRRSKRIYELEVVSWKGAIDLPHHSVGLDQDFGLSVLSCPDSIRINAREFKAYIVSILVIFLLIIAVQDIALAQPKVGAVKAEAKKAEPAPPKFNVGEFTYTSANRRDPFETSFLKDIKQQAGKASVLKKGYELEELKLVGIMKAGSRNLAMMEDMQSKGILFKKNDYLNKNLWITDIFADKVEFGYKIKGETKTFSIEIPRKKEGM
ncbi:MAG: pilus assembly protein PilP [Proteobacteria bacterium]|nr:pilus assembly protein PilP [Pseudomonadota bacterium]